MKFFIAITLLSTFSLSAFAKDPILTCTIQNPKTKQAATAKINLNNISVSGALNKGIDSGKDNYSFSMSVEKIKKEYQFDVIFQQNNSAEDEVGDKRCVYTEAKGKRVFCYEELTSDSGLTVAIFYCQVK